MIHFIFMILPGLLSFSILYGSKGEEATIKTLKRIDLFTIMRDLIILIFVVNLVGLYLGKRMFGGGDTFIDGQLHPNYLSLGYLGFILLVALSIGILGQVYRNNVKIYITKEKEKSYDNKDKLRKENEQHKRNNKESKQMIGPTKKGEEKR